MGMTMTQKILADHAGVKEVHAGELIEANVDIVMANDITGPMALPIFKKMADKVFDKDKVKYSDTRQSELKSFDIGDRNNRMVRLKIYLFSQYYKSRHN